MMSSVLYGVALSTALATTLPAVDPAIVEKVNLNPEATWRAGHGKGRFANATLVEASMLLGAHRSLAARADAVDSDAVTVDLPDSFDLREQYGHCKSIQAVYDQGHCGGCWAFAVAESLGDRFCVQGVDVVLSAQDLMSCDHTGKCNGCGGGLTEDAFDYISEEGMLAEDCVPWTGSDSVCTDSKCAVTGADTTRYYSSWAKYVSSDEAKIKQELFQYGSITASFEVFHDFFSYESGVYSHLEGDYAGLHAVNLMGWGTDSGVDYWLVKNSWGSDFGEEGFFRIQRGLTANGCNFEGGLTSGSATVSRSVAV